MKIDVDPSRVSFDIQADETILEAALRNGYTWPTICGGQGTCKTCVFLTIEGEAHLSPIGSWEATGLRSIEHSLSNNGQGWRLACQAKVSADVRVRKIGVRKQHGNS